MANWAVANWAVAGGSSICGRRTADRIARALCFLFPLLLATSIGAAPPLGGPLAPKTFGPWVVAASSDRDGMFDGCVADRQMPELRFGLRRDVQGVTLHLLSPRWRLAADATYPVLLADALRGGEEVLGRVVRSDRIEMPLGDAEQASALLRAAGEQLQVRAARATLTLPIDGMAPVLAALGACWEDGVKAAANPFAAVAAGSSPLPGDAADEGLAQEQTFFDAEIDGKVYRLEAAVVRPARREGKLPIALITHGTTTDPAEMAAMRATNLLPQARDLAHRGYLAVAVARRGYGLSQGPPRLAVANCARPRFLKGFEADADELEAVLRLVRSRPDADPAHAIAIGVSGGGGAVLALAARAPEGLAGAVNVSGGLNLIRDDGSHCEVEADLAEAFADLGHRIRIPNLWIYARNDSFFPPDLVRRLHATFEDGRTGSDLEMLPPIGTNGHDIFVTSQGRYHWLPRLDGFLRAHNLSTWDAAETDLAMRSGRLGAEQRPWLERYLSAPTHKTMAVTRSGHGLRLRFGQADAAAARTAAIADCEATFDEPCSVLMQDFTQSRPPARTALLNEPAR